MAGINAGNVIEYRLQGRLFGQITLNTFHYYVQFDSSLPTYSQSIQAAANGFSTGTNNPTLALLAAQTAEFTLDGIWAQRIYPTRDRAFFSSLSLPGVNTGTCAAPNQAATIEKWSWEGGRHGIGSLHIPGVPVEQQLLGLWTNTYRTILETVATRMKANYAPPTDTPCIQLPVILNRANKPNSKELQGTTVQGTVRVMRRRTIGVGK